MKFLIDEDISPSIALILCEEKLVDAIAVRDRGLLGASDREVLEYAFNEERIVITANVKDFEKFAQSAEIHAGIIFIVEGDLLRSEQLKVCFFAIEIIEKEISAGRDMINRVLYISINGTKELKTLP